MDFALLGSFEIRRDGMPVELTGARQRALLAVLLLRADQVVPSDRLLEDVWGDAQPTAGSAALGRARSALAHGAPCPVLFVRGGVSPSGLAPPEARTRFTWTRLGF